MPFFPGPVVRSMGATVYGRANRESLYFGDPRPAFCVSLAVYFYRLPAGALRHFGVLLLYLTRHFHNSPNFPKSPKNTEKLQGNERRTQSATIVSKKQKYGKVQAGTHFHQKGP